MKRLVILLFGILIASVAVPKDANAVSTNELKVYEQQYTAEQADKEWSNELVAYASQLKGKRTGQCVIALRTYFGVPKSEVSGLAKTTKVNSTTPKVGSVIVLKMSSYGHVGLVIAERGDSVVYFDSNGDWKQRGAIRVITKTDPRIKGYRIIKA